MAWIVFALLVASIVIAARMIYRAIKSQDFWFGQAYYWRARAISSEKENTNNLYWRAAYERALSLPVRSDQDCLDDLWARAYQGDELAEAILCEKLAIDTHRPQATGERGQD